MVPNLVRRLGSAMPFPRRLTRTATRPIPLRLVFMAVGAAAILIARARRAPAPVRTVAADAWSDVPSAPQWSVPAPVPITRYDELRAVDIARSVRRMDDPDEIQRVLDYEKTHHQRVTVFKAARARLRALEASSA